MGLLPLLFSRTNPEALRPSTARGQKTRSHQPFDLPTVVPYETTQAFGSVLPASARAPMTPENGPFPPSPDFWPVVVSVLQNQSYLNFLKTPKLRHPNYLVKSREFGPMTRLLVRITNIVINAVKLDRAIYLPTSWLPDRAAAARFTSRPGIRRRFVPVSRMRWRVFGVTCLASE